MGLKIGGRLANTKGGGRGALLAEYYYYDYSGVQTEGQLYIEAASAAGYSGGSATCAQEFFTLLDNIA